MKKIFTLLSLVLFSVVQVCNAQSNPDEAALLLAAMSGNAKQIKELTDKGVNVNIRNDGGITPLMMALYADKIDAIKALLAAGASTEIQDRYKKTAIYCSVSPEAMKIMLEAKANYNYVLHKTNFNALSFYAGCSDNMVKRDAIVKTMMEFGVPIHSPKDNVEQPIYVAVSANNLEVVKLFVKAGVDPHYVNSKSGQNLMFQAFTPAMINLLHSYNVTPDHVSNEGDTPISRSRTLRILRALLAIGADPNIVRKLDAPMFHFSVFASDPYVKGIRKLSQLEDTEEGEHVSKDDAQTIALESVRLLINAPKKGDVNLVIPYMKNRIATPLDFATIHRYDKVVKYLVANGAKLSTEIGK